MQYEARRACKYTASWLSSTTPSIPHGADVAAPACKKSISASKPCNSSSRDAAAAPSVHKGATTDGRAVQHCAVPNTMVFLTKRRRGGSDGDDGRERGSGAGVRQSLGPMPPSGSSGGSDALGNSLTVAKAFKCPVPNYVPMPKRGGTLGQRFNWKGQLCDFGRVVSISPSEVKAIPTGKPLLIFDPGSSSCTREDKDKLTRVEVESFIADRLRPHQVEGVKFMVECLMGLRDQNHSGCILADGMGLGKTFQSCAVIYTLMTAGIHSKPTSIAPLILCPSSLVSNWGNELRKWLGDRVQPVLMDDTRAAKVKETLQDFKGNSQSWLGALGAKRRGPLQVLVMSYSTYRTHKQLVCQKGIDMVVADEGHFLKNGNSQITKAVMAIPAKVRLLLTGTPIQNDLQEFYTLMDVAVPGLLGDAALFRKKFENPIIRSQDADATDADVQRGQERSAELLQTCSRFMIRRTSSINKQYLPKMVETVVFCRMAKLQQSLYSHFLASPPVQRALQGKSTLQPGADQPGNLQALPAITALKKLCCHPDLIYSMQAKAAGLDRPPCSGRLAGSGRAASGAQRPAGMAGAASGAAGAGSSAITGFEGCLPVFSRAYPTYEPMACQMLHSGKITVLINLLKAVRQHDPTDKVVLVSNYTESLQMLARMCTLHNWKYLSLDGSMDTKLRQPTVDCFNNPADPSFVLLLSSKAGGTGLNIVGANRLVLMDPDWNPANDAQAMARVWREGQKKAVWIYRLLTTGSIEEKMYQRQLSKMGLSKSIVDDANQSRQFSAEELRSLFKVDLNTMCDTHNAIKCKCDGSRATMDQKAAVFMDKAQQGQLRQRQRLDDSGNPVEGEAASNDAGDGVIEWAHLRDALHSPDAVWPLISSHIRDTYITYMFSDHVTNPDLKAAALEDVIAEEEQEQALVEDAPPAEFDACE